MKKAWKVVIISVILIVLLISIVAIINSNFDRKRRHPNNINSPKSNLEFNEIISRCQKQFPNKLDCEKLITNHFKAIENNEVVTYPGRPIQFTGQNQRVLWIGAHPDDEANWLAPVLGKLCRDLNGNCTLLIGKAPYSVGKCFLPGGCPKNQDEFRQMRIAEAENSGKLYNADIIIEHDVNIYVGADKPMQRAIDYWHNDIGIDVLIENKKNHIERIQPDIILTSDPRLGDYCHPEHRLHGWLTIQALEKAELNKEPKVYFTQGIDIPFVTSDSHLIYDAAEPSIITGSDTWQYRILNHEIYKIPLDPKEIKNLESFADWRRKIYLLEYNELFNPSDPNFNICNDNLNILRIPK